jgi:ribosomal protein L16 Arg81 hydroxylase
MNSNAVRVRSTTLAALLDPVAVQTFLDEHFGKRPLLVRGVPGKFDALMKPSDFIYGLDRVPEIRCVFRQLKQATISPVDIREMYEAGATICVTGIDSAHRSLRTAARQIRKEIGYAGRVDFRAYLSPPGAGFDIHYDARVATTLQLLGTKTWRYSSEPDSAFPTENSSRANLAGIRREVGKLKLRKVTLRPGDLLCLPAGAWHKAQAGAGGSLALNLTFNHVGATVLDIVMQELRKTLSNLPACREPFFRGPGTAHATPLYSNINQCVDTIAHALLAMKRASALRLLGRSALQRDTGA